MSDDIFAGHRRTPRAPSTGEGSAAPLQEYVAFGTKDRAKRIRIRAGDFNVQAPGYNILLNLSYDCEHWKEVELIFTVMSVKIFGNHLQKVVFAMENDMADFIQEFDSERWQRPADANAAVIDKIEITVFDEAPLKAGGEDEV